MCFGIFMAARRANRELETYLEDGIFTPQLPEKKAEAWHKWIENLKTRFVPLYFHVSLLLFNAGNQIDDEIINSEYADEIIDSAIMTARG
jgi:hypothetical protein